MFRGRAAVLVLAFAVATVSLLIAAPALFSGDAPFSADSELGSLSRQESEGTQAVNFTCDAGTEWAFNVTVWIDLSDGMDREEAVLVAKSLYESIHKNSTCNLKSTQANEDGTWTIYLLWDGSHYFNVEVNPHDRTLDFNSCL